MGSYLGFSGTRHRLSASINDIYKTKLATNKAKLLQKSVENCKFSSLKLVLTIILCLTLISLLRQNPYPAIRHQFARKQIENPPHDPRYVSNTEINWNHTSTIIQNLQHKIPIKKIGFLNFKKQEITQWKHIVTPNIAQIILKLDYASENVTWEKLFPEWIDEEEENEVPICPSLPKLRGPKRGSFDLIAVKLPGRKESNGAVGRLHLQLAVASFVASLGGDCGMHLLFFSDGLPELGLFSCRELVGFEGDVWLYRPDVEVLKEKVGLPVGSCELALRLGGEERIRPQREAYATILHSADAYVCGAITAAQSIRATGSTKDLIILVDDAIATRHRAGLEAAGWQVRAIQRIRNPKAKPNAYNEFNYSKLRLWQLTDYDKIVFIDADMLVLRNIDALFRLPQLSATANNGSIFNSGVMVLEPSNCTFRLLHARVRDVDSYNGGDQGFLNEIFGKWNRIPRRVNYLKHFWGGDGAAARAEKTRLFGAEPPELYVLHYLGLKPWLCFRDYDCNWNADSDEFASDVAHARWWRVHDSMPEGLQRFCLLGTRQKAKLEWDRRKAEEAKRGDEHWKVKVRDPRLGVCIDRFCDWEEMLRHWGETRNRSVARLRPAKTKALVEIAFVV